MLEVNALSRILLLQSDPLENRSNPHRHFLPSEKIQIHVHKNDHAVVIFHRLIQQLYCFIQLVQSLQRHSLHHRKHRSVDV